MGNCFTQSKRTAADVAPYDCVKQLPAARLYGSATSPLTAYLRFALLHKNLSPQFVPAEGPPALQIGSDTVSGCREALLSFIEAKVPHPRFAVGLEGGRTPSVERVTWLQHRSIRWHVERMVRWAEDLAARGGKRAGDPVMGSPRMEVRKFGKSYSQLLEVMLEHAQMEETVVFPLLETADRGICKEANEEHARDLPIMNGIKEDVKSVGVLNSGNPTYQEALSNLSTRLKSLQKHCKQHFDEEEGNLLPLIEATELSKEQQQRVLEQCFDAMKATHSHLFNFFLEGLLPQEAMQYLDLIMKCDGREETVSMVHMIIE